MRSRTCAASAVVVVLAVISWPVAAVEVVANGTLAADATSWTFVAVSGSPSGSWDASGYADGGALRISSELGRSKSGEGRWQQDLPAIDAGSTVTLSYAWKKDRAERPPARQDIHVSVLRPDASRVDLSSQPGAPGAYGAWNTATDIDVSGSFDQTGVYTLELRYVHKTGKHNAARAEAWLDQVALAVTTPAGTWVARAATPDPGAFGQALVGTGDHLYVVRCTSATATPSLWRYDPADDAWVTLSVDGLPAGALRNGATLTWDVASYLYALGGARYSDDDRRSFFRYDIAGDGWAQLTDTPAAQGAGDAATWSDTDGVLYALLGSSGHGRAFAKYDPGADAWTTLAAPPAGIDDGASLAWAGGSQLYALRGEYEESSPLTDFWRYDTADDAWTSLADIPEPDGVGDGGSLLWTGSFDAATTDTLFALGGGGYDEAGGADVYRYMVSTDTWEELPDLPHALGNYNGNRIGYADGFVHAWQGSPGTWDGGGDFVARYKP